MDEEQLKVQGDEPFDASDDNVIEDAVAHSGKPPFILLHGFAQSSHSWDKVASALRARGHEVFVPDLMNADPVKDELDSRSKSFDELSDNAQEVSLETYQNDAVDPQDVIALGKSTIKSAYALLSTARNMEDLCDATAELVCAVTCACQCPPVLLGYSMGGRIALQTLVYYGDSLPLTALILESAGLGPRDEAERKAFSDRSKQWVLRLEEEGIESFIDWWETLPLFATQRSLPPEVRDRVRAERIGCGADKLIRMIEGVEQHRQSYAKDSLTALNDACESGLNVLYLVGALDDRYGIIADDMLELSPGVEIHFVSRAGHNIHLERPGVFTSDIAAWIDAVSLDSNEDCGSI